jgi:SPP1 family phage portal protein
VRRSRHIIGTDGQLKEDTSLPATRIAHGFVRKLVDQKAQYLFGRPFTIRCADRAFAERLNRLFDPSARSMMRGLCKEAVNKGIAWMQIWPENGEIRMQKIPSEELIPIWEDGGHHRLQKMLHVFPMEVYRKGGRQVWLRVRCWDEDGVQDYWYKDGRLEEDGEKMPHLTLDGQGLLLEQLPFVPFRYNEEELPLIQFIKPLVDDYDLLKSQDSDNLGETSGALMVLQNYDGTDLGEFRENLARYKAVKVSDGGGLDIKTQPVHTDAVLAHLKQDRKDLYEVGRGVDTQTETIGNASGVAMRFLYADLDLDCAGIESAFAAAFAEMVRMIGLYYRLMGVGDFVGLQADIILNRDIVVNESDAIDQCVSSEGILSKRTVLENHPWVVNVEEELERLEGESTEKPGEESV